MNKKRKDDIVNKDKVLSGIHDASMSEAARIAKREYHRKWQRENRKKVALYQTRYWERKAQEIEVGSTEVSNA